MASITGTVLNLSGQTGYDANANDFDTLRDLLIAADSLSSDKFAGIGLVAALDTVPSLTVFAPDDGAFAGLASTIARVTGNAAPQGEAATAAFLTNALTLLSKGEPGGLLTSILTYHVLPGVYRLADIAVLGDGASLPTLQGGGLQSDFDTIPPSLIDGDVGVPNPGIKATDIEASNGVVHVVDGVLLPISVSSILTQPDTDFRIGDQRGNFFATGIGDDFVDGNGGSDFLFVGAGNDVAIGGLGNDWITGGDGDDSVLGEAGSDKVWGGAGSDNISGGAGRDWLAGGSDADNFAFARGDGRDTIVDFCNGIDRIDLSGYVGIDSFDDIEIKSTWFGAKLELGCDDVVTLLGVHKSQIDAGDFVF